MFQEASPPTPKSGTSHCQRRSMLCCLTHYVECSGTARFQSQSLKGRLAFASRPKAEVSFFELEACMMLEGSLLTDSHIPRSCKNLMRKHVTVAGGDLQSRDLRLSGQALRPVWHVKPLSILSRDL